MIKNQKIIIQKSTSGVDSINSPVPVYEEYMRILASVYVRSNDIKYNELQGMFCTTEFTINWSAKGMAIDNSYQVVFNNKEYSIIEVSEIRNRDGIKTGIKIIGTHYGN